MKVFEHQLLIRGNAGSIGFTVPTHVLRKLIKWDRDSQLVVDDENYPHTSYRVRHCDRGGVIIETGKSWAAIAYSSWDELCKMLTTCIKCGDTLDLPNDGLYLCEGCGPERTSERL